MDLESGKILCKAKSLTTREDLSIGIRGSIVDFDTELLKQVGVVSLSSTLATNSVVEGKGCRVALVCIGSEYDFSVRPDFDTVVEGGHDLHGEEIHPLDEDAARDRFRQQIVMDRRGHPQQVGWLDLEPLRRLIADEFDRFLFHPCNGKTNHFPASLSSLTFAAITGTAAGGT